MSSRFLTPREFADLMRVSIRTVETWRSRGGGPPFARVGKHVVYDKIDVDLWINERTYLSYAHELKKKEAAHGGE